MNSVLDQLAADGSSRYIDELTEAIFGYASSVYRSDIRRYYPHPEWGTGPRCDPPGGSRARAPRTGRGHRD